jgi:hypothetical protein
VANSLHTEQHPGSLRWAVFEDDGVSAWLYLTRPEETRPVADCWIYNRVPAPPLARIHDYRSQPPPASAEYVAEGAQRLEARAPDVRFAWSQDGESVAVLIDGVSAGFIVAGSRRGCNRQLTRPGPWGNPWDDGLYRQTFTTIDRAPGA